MNKKNLYDYLVAHHYGRENGVTRSILASVLGVTERELRKTTKAINEDPNFEKLVSTEYSCYICKTESECRRTINNTYKVAVALFKKAKKMEKKVGLNGQIKILIGDEEETKDFYETFLR